VISAASILRRKDKRIPRIAVIPSLILLILHFETKCLASEERQRQRKEKAKTTVGEYCERRDLDTNAIRIAIRDDPASLFYL
jgi:hypothetical protein